MKRMKRINAEEIARWLMDDSLVAERYNPITMLWRHTDNPLSWPTEPIRVSIATVEGKPLFDGDEFYDNCGDKRVMNLSYYYYNEDSWDKFWDKCTLTPPKPKSILDSDEFYNLVVSLSVAMTFNEAKSSIKLDTDKLKQFLLDPK